VQPRPRAHAQNAFVAPLSGGRPGLHGDGESTATPPDMRGVIGAAGNSADKRIE